MSKKIKQEIYEKKKIRFSKSTAFILFILVMVTWALILYITYFDIYGFYYSIVGAIIAVAVWSFGWLFKNHPNKTLQKIVGYNDYRSIVWDPRATWRTIRIFLKWMFINIGVFTFSNPRGYIKNFAALQSDLLYSFYSHIFIGILIGQGILVVLWLFFEFPQRFSLLKMKSSNIVYAINVLTFVFVTAFLSVSLPTTQYYLSMNKYWFSFWYVVAGVNMVPRLLMSTIDADARRIATLKKYQIPEFLEKKINDELNDIAFVKSKKAILLYALYLGFFYQFARVTWTMINFYIFWSEIARLRTQRKALRLLEQEGNRKSYDRMIRTKLFWEKRRLNQILEFSEVVFGLAEVQKGVLKAKKSRIEKKKKLSNQDLVDKASFSFELDTAENFKNQALRIRKIAQNEISYIFKAYADVYQKEAEKLIRKKMEIEQQCYKLESECLDDQQKNPIRSFFRNLTLSRLEKKGNKIQLKAENIFNESLTHNMRSAYFLKESETHIPMKSIMKNEIGHLAKTIFDANDNSETEEQ